MASLPPDGKGAQCEEDKMRMDPASLEDAARMIYEATNKSGKPWWYRWLIEDMQPWFHIAAASSQIARSIQSEERTRGARKNADPLDARKAKLKAMIRLDPSNLERHWGEIQRLIFLELSEGKDNLARNLAPILAGWNATESELSEAVATDDSKRFAEAWTNRPSSDSPGFADRACRHLVKFWSEFRDGIPPFCCWSDEALASYFNGDEFAGTEKAKRAQLKNLEDRRNALSLIKVPCVIVTGWQDHLPVIEDRPPPESDDRIGNTISKITPEVFELAFPGAQIGSRAKDWLLTLNRNLQRLPDETREFLLSSLK